MFLRETSTAPRCLADLLPWAALVAPGLVLNKDGSLLAGFELRGPDLDSSTPEELAVLCEQANAGFLLGDSWAVHCDALRVSATPYPDAGDFPDPVTRAIDDERRSRYRLLFETRTNLVLTYFPPPETQSRLRSIFLNRPTTSRPRENVLQEFEASLADLQGALGSILHLERLDDQALVTHLHSCVSGLFHPVQLCGDGLPLDVLLASQDLIGGLEPRIGDMHIAVLALAGLPLATSPGMLDVLGRLPFPCRFSTRFLPLEPFTAERLMGAQRRFWLQKRRGLSWLLKAALSQRSPQEPQGEAEDLDSLRMLRDLDEARAEAAGGEVRYGTYTATLLLLEEDRRLLDKNAKEALAAIRNAGIGARRESVNALEGYLASLPGQVAANVRRPILHTRNLTHLLPLTSVWPGRATNPSPMSPPGGFPALLWTAASQSAFRLNLHAQGDVGHTLVVGPTGAGKSTLLASLIASWRRYSGARVVCFDKGYSALPLTWAAGGHHYDIAAPGEDLSFCPLGRIADPSERTRAEEWVHMLFELNSVALSPEQRREIAETLDLLSKAKTQPTLTDLWIKLQDPALRAALVPYTVTRNSALLDAPSDELASSAFVTFEMSHLLERGPLIVLPTLLYLFHRIRGRLDGAPTLIVLDEAWTFLDHPRFTAWLRSSLKELRKLNAAVLFATQSLADLAGSSLREVLLESTATKLYLPNPQAENESIAPYYRELGLNPRQLRLIATALPKRDYYASSSEGNRLFRFQLGPLELAFCGAGSPEDLVTIRRLRAEHGHRWPLPWLRLRQLDTWAERLAPYLERSVCS